MRYGAIAASGRTTTTTPGTTARFYGDPGAGNFYLGVAPQVSTIATHETKMGAPLAMIRTYSTSNTPPWASVDSIIAGGRLPWLSWLEGGKTNADIGNGLEDTWIRSIATDFKARAPWPLFWTFHHEPENDTNSSGANAAAYRAAQRRIKTVFRSEGVTNDIFISNCFMTPFTFNAAASGRDWRTWYPDWRNVTGLGSGDAPDPNDFWKHGDPNAVVDAIGLDFYHGWDLAGLPGDTHAKWLTVTGSNVWSARLQPKIEFLNQPLAIGEWSTAASQDGFTKDPNGDGSWTLTEYAADAGIFYLPAETDQWIDDYFTTLTAHGCFAFCWWDQRLTSTTTVANNPLSIADPAETRWKRLGVWGNKPQAKSWPLATPGPAPAPAARENTLQGGAPNQALTTANSGLASGDAFDFVVTNTGTQTYRQRPTTPVTADSMYVDVAPVPNALTYHGWTSTFLAGSATVYGAAEIELQNAYPSAGLPLGLVRVTDSTGTTLAGINVDNLGHVATVRTGGAAQTTGTAVVPLNTRVRVEWHFVLGSTSGLLEARLFTNPTGTTPAETLSAVADTTGTPGQLRTGSCVARTTGPPSFRVYRVAWNSSDWPGPWTGSPASPLQVRDGVVAHGVSAEGAEDAFEADSQRGVAIVNWYETWGTHYQTGFNTATAQTYDSQGQTNMISWLPGDGTSSSTSATYTLAAIIAGNHDTHIQLWADGVKAFGKPVFLRFAHEMNGDWYQWGTKGGNNGNTAAQYVQAWQHVRDIFTAKSVTNVTWVWCPNSPFTGSTSMASLYPGDTYVDWVALDAYNFGTDTGGSWKSVPTTFDAGFTELRAVNNVKPVMIAETGSSENGGSKAQWFTDLFAALKTNYPYVQALVYFNLDKTGTTSNWKIETTPTAQAAYAAGVADPRYGTRSLSTFRR